MSENDPHIMRRPDKLMESAEAEELLANGFCGRMGTVGEDGYPYVVPLLYVRMGDEIWVHNTASRGHLRTNVDHDSRVCFEVDESGEVFPYGRFDCDTSVSYRSVIAFGRIRIVEDRDEKTRFCSELMHKYANTEWDRPKDFFPRLDEITVYAISVERMTGKKTPLPDSGKRWPALDRTRTPHIGPPAQSNP